MNNIEEIRQRCGESKELYDAVDENWEEIKIKRPNETEYNHYVRFCEYKQSMEFIGYILGFRNPDNGISESVNSFKTRNHDIRLTDDTLKYAAFDQVLKDTCRKYQRETLIEHYYRFINFEATNAFKDSIKQRNGESEQDARIRFIKYTRVKDEIIKKVEDDIKSEFERLDEEETLEEWKERVEGIIQQYNNFICDPRILSKEDFREETSLEYGNRIRYYNNFVMIIEKLILSDKFDEKMKDAKWKETQKLEARREIEEAEAERLKEIADAEQEVKMNKAKIHVFSVAVFSSSIVGFLMIIQYFSFNAAAISSIIVIIGISITTWFLGKDRVKFIFKCLIEILFYGLKFLNIVLNSSGKSLTNNRRF